MEPKHDKLLKLMKEIDQLVRRDDLDSWVAKDNATRHEKWVEFTAIWDMLNSYMEGQ